jgi:hypothetical protein
VVSQLCEYRNASKYLTQGCSRMASHYFQHRIAFAHFNVCSRLLLLIVGLLRPRCHAHWNSSTSTAAAMAVHCLANLAPTRASIRIPCCCCCLCRHARTVLPTAKRSTAIPRRGMPACSALQPKALKGVCAAFSRAPFVYASSPASEPFAALLRAAAGAPVSALARPAVTPCGNSMGPIVAACPLCSAPIDHRAAADPPARLPAHTARRGRILHRTDGCGRSYAGFDAFPTYFIYGGLVFAVRPAAPLVTDSSVIWGRVTLPLWSTVLGPSQPLVCAAYPPGN